MPFTVLLGSSIRFYCYFVFHGCKAVMIFSSKPFEILAAVTFLLTASFLFIIVQH
jgi:hypothetical protein